jgi:hypothetical protein
MWKMFHLWDTEECGKKFHLWDTKECGRCSIYGIQKNMEKEFLAFSLPLEK